jgi:hypothetical protein
LLLGSLLVPLGIPLHRAAAAARAGADDGAPEEEPAEPADINAEIARLGGIEPVEPAAPFLPLSLPFARRDLDRLRLILAAERRLRQGHQAGHHGLAGRGYFEEALRWVEIHGGREGRELAAAWRVAPDRPPSAAGDAPAPLLRERAGRRRRRGRRRGPRTPPAA